MPVTNPSTQTFMVRLEWCWPLRAARRCGDDRILSVAACFGWFLAGLHITDSPHLCPIAPNHLAARVETPMRPGEVWQADITYVATKEGWLYVAGVLDACSRKIVGWGGG